MGNLLLFCQLCSAANRWMRPHGKAVRSLSISHDPLESQFSVAELAELMALVDCCLALCSCGLEKLGIEWVLEEEFTVGAWAMAAPHLRQLSIDAWTLRTWFPLNTGMTALQFIKITPHHWHLSMAVELPVSLTRLHIHQKPPGRSDTTAGG
jgi:hypothetical protein